MAITWKVDPSHSEVQFKVKHLMITTVTGYFKQFDLTVETETEDFNTASRIEFSADINSIDTNNAQRDTHLKSNDFFNAEEHPKLKFVGKKYEGSGDSVKLQGDLTISGIINRKDFNLTWNAVTEAGQVVVSNDIRFNCEIQLVKQAVEAYEDAA
jgi:polyisoprenoid-binding protein YceI